MLQYFFENLRFKTEPKNDNWGLFLLCTLILFVEMEFENENSDFLSWQNEFADKSQTEKNE